MRICYLILVHHKFAQALRMIRRLAGPGCGFVLHIDRSANASAVASFKEQLQRVAPVVYAPRVRSRWGSYHQALSIMRCVETALQAAEPFDRYVLLSGQDYPIKDRARIEDFFTGSPETEYIEAFPRDLRDAEAPGWSPYFRFRRYHVWIGRRRLALPLLRRGPPPLPIYHGSTWWALTRAAAVYVAEQFRADQRLGRYLRTGFLVDEVYIPTLIMGSVHASRVAGRNVTYAEWTPTSGPHPKVLRLEDLPQLLASAKLFARKVDASVDESLLDELDRLHERAAEHRV